MMCINLPIIIAIALRQTSSRYNGCNLFVIAILN